MIGIAAGAVAGTGAALGGVAVVAMAKSWSGLGLREKDVGPPTEGVLGGVAWDGDGARHGRDWRRRRRRSAGMRMAAVSAGSTDSHVREGGARLREGCGICD
jgi:hypothetical protein